MDVVELGSQTKRYRLLALFCNLSLLIFVMLWHSVISPHPQINPYGLMIAWMIPLLLPLKGILEGKPYTHAWANFILMFYFLHGFTLLWVDEGERYLAVIELILTSGAFIGNIYYARLRGKELGLKLKLLSEVEKIEKASYAEKKQD
ncbi:DUF2069 domain-containing protein [Aliivibrio sp. SR45-2]|uniref:DUF2069 domain-containing protein n=1 Tax=Aliivibrio sp. SR45-2 TaxID=2760931 RepID=UPI0015F92E34|nr:DUF2069 domain-containing protein [Aliivibrio sp. SR45-2]MBB1313893.1 DUF2069 domain-containing protein [Aliivibrio sp. SR45-2]